MLADTQYPRDFRDADLFDVLEQQHFAIVGPELRQRAIEFAVRAAVAQQWFVRLSKPRASNRARRALVRMSDRTLRCAIAQANVNSELSPRKNGSASASAMKVSCKTSSASAAAAPSELAMKRRMRAA